MKFFIIALAVSTTVSIDLLMEEDGFISMAKEAYSNHDWDEALKIGTDWINERF